MSADGFINLVLMMCGNMCVSVFCSCWCVFMVGTSVRHLRGTAGASRTG